MRIRQTGRRNGAVIVCGVVMLFVIAGAARAQEAIPDPHHHGNLGENSFLDEVKGDVRIEEAEDRQQPPKGKGIYNPERTMRAFTVDFKDTGREQLCVEDLKTGKVIAIDGLPFPHRPYSDITWAKGGLLVFDRSASPRTGAHYVVDMKSMKLVVAAFVSF
jgi:hypothetical protein